MEDKIIKRINEIPAQLVNMQKQLMDFTTKTKADKVGLGFNALNLFSLQAVFMELITILNDTSKISEEALSIYNSIVEATRTRDEMLNNQEEAPQELKDFLNKEV